MDFATPLVPATLLRRYKRFLADIRLADGQEVTAHVANPGAMLGLAEPGSRIWVEPNDDPKKKLKFGWRLVETAPGQFTGVDTGLANRVVKEALLAGQVPELAGYDDIRAEVKYGEGSRIDFLLTGAGRPDCYVEVKSATLLRQPARAEFPDCVTARGAKHLTELAAMQAAGHRAVMFYLVQRTDATGLMLAGDLDPTYARTFHGAGLETLVYRGDISPRGIALGPALPFHPGG